MRRALAALLLVLMAACATMGKPSVNGVLKANALAFASAADAYTTMMERGRVSHDKAKWASAALVQPASDLKAFRALLAGCAAPCDVEQITAGLQPSLRELERKLREEQAATKAAQARSRDAVSSQSLLGSIIVINDALQLIDAAAKLFSAFSGLDNTTDAQVDAAFAKLDASRAALDKAIAAY